jgi:hypothetical protein
MHVHTWEWNSHYADFYCVEYGCHERLTPYAGAERLSSFERASDGLLALKVKHKETWKTRSVWYWAWRLFLEWLELIGALLKVHNDLPEWELLQIASIAVNFRERLLDRSNQ